MSNRWIECQQRVLDALPRHCPEDRLTPAAGGRHLLDGIPLVVNPDLPEHILWQLLDGETVIKCCVQHEDHTYLADVDWEWS